MAKLIDCRAEGFAHKNKMVPPLPPSASMLTGGPFSHPYPERDLTSDPHPASLCPQTRVWGWGGGEGISPSPLRSRFPSHPPPTQPRLPSRSQSLVEQAAPSCSCATSLSSPAPISSDQAPSGLPLLPGSSNSVLSHYRIWRCLPCLLPALLWGHGKGMCHIQHDLFFFRPPKLI